MFCHRIAFGTTVRRCKRIIDAVTPRDKAFAALESFIETGGYDHGYDLERYSTEAARSVLNNHKHTPKHTPAKEAQ